MSVAELTGRTLGDFVVRHRIGEGGFGEVYRAEQPVLGREAVIKVLHYRHRATKTVIQRFLREARLASRLDHPYAAHIYAFGVEADGLTWIAMEYVKGKTLYDMLRENGPMALEELVPLLDRICEVLQAAHDLGIVHRDIKPPNVMVVQRSGRAFPKLLDFGIAKASVDTVAPVDHPASDGAEPQRSGQLSAPAIEVVRAVDASRADRPAGESSPGDHTVSFVGQVGGVLGGGLSPRSEEPASPAAPPGFAATLAVVSVSPVSIVDVDGPALTEEGATMGSPPYMAPEQWEDSSAATARTDLYALAILTYEALVGRRPITGPTLAALAMAHLSAPIPALGAAFPVELDAVMVKALAKRPDERYPSALAFAQAFRTAAGFGSQPLPAIDDDLRLSIEASFPQPIAEAVAAFHAARNAHQGRDALREVVTTSIRYVALIALAAQAQVRLVEPGSAAIVAELVRELRRRPLTDEEWLRLARSVVSPFQPNPRVHPLPDLVSVLAGTDESDPLTVVAQPHAADHDPLATIRALLPHVTRMLRALTFLADHPLVVVAEGRAESWMGLRRPRRVAIELRGRLVDPDRPVLADPRGNPIVSLWPLIQSSSPMPNAPPELFLLDGRGRRGGRLIALPQTLERQDESVWDWLGEHFGERDGEKPALTGSQDAKPYRGLSSFTSLDADAFVGREREVDAALNRLKVSSLIAVVGPSGSGKSSFVHAGVVPSLPEGWTTISVRPGTTPIALLESRLRRAGLAVPDLAGAIARDPAALAQVFQGRSSPTVLVIDQFEELFTLGASPEQQQHYVRALLAAAETTDDKVRIILTLRDDFLARATQVAELRERLPASLFLLGTPGRHELVRILTEPLARHGFDFDDPALPRRMVDEVAETPGALALLSFTANKLWELRDRHFRQLTRKAYDAMGGVVGALAQHGEATLAAMSAGEQRLARIALGHLVTADGTRAVLSRRELGELLNDPQADGVIEKLIVARLLTATETEGGDDSVEVVHEALLVAWPRLAEWRREDLEGARLRDQVRAAARQWIERDRPRGLLWRDEALAELQVWRARHPQPLTATEEAFVTASFAEAARGRRFRRAVIASIGVLLTIAVLVLISANRQTAKERSRAEQLTDAAEHSLTEQYFEQGRQLALSGDAPRAMAYLAEAFDRGLDTPGMRYLIDSSLAPISGQRLVLKHDDKVYTTQWSPDGALLASASADGTARLWDAATGVQVAVMRSNGPTLSCRFSTRGSLVATANGEGMIRIYDLHGTLVREMAGPGGGAPEVRFSPDDTMIAAATAHGAGLWDVASGKSLLAFPNVNIATVAFSADGTRLVAVGDTAEIYDPVARTKLATLVGHNGYAMSAAFSADSAYLITTGVDQTARLWNARTGAAMTTLRSEGGMVRAAAFDPLGRTVTTVTSGSIARVWKLPDGEPGAILDGHAAGVRAVDYDRNGTRIASAGADGRVVIWNAATGSQVASLQGHLAAVVSVQFSPDGKEIVTGSNDGTLRVWKPVFEPLRAMLVHPEDLDDAQFSPDGTRLVTACLDHQARIFDAETGQLVRSVVDDGAIHQARFTFDGAHLVTGGDHRVVVWNLADGAIVAATVVEHPINRLAISRDGMVSFGDDAGSASIWRPGTAPQRLLSGTRAVRAITFSPDGQLLAIGGWDNFVRLWRTRDLVPAIAPIDLHRRVWDIAFSPDGARIAVAQDGVATTIRVPAGTIEHVMRHGGFVETVRFRPDGKQLATASEDGTAGLWNAETGALDAQLRSGSNVVFMASYDPTGRFVVTAGDDRTAAIWDTASGEMLQRLRGHSVSLWTSMFSPAGNRILTQGLDYSVGLWNFELARYSPAELARVAACQVPWQVSNGKLELRTIRCDAK